MPILIGIALYFILSWFSVKTLVIFIILLLMFKN